MNSTVEQMRHTANYCASAAETYRSWADEARRDGNPRADYYQSEAERLEGQSRFFADWAERSDEHVEA